jgi:hypothetical protein
VVKVLVDKSLAVSFGGCMALQAMASLSRADAALVMLHFFLS